VNLDGWFFGAIHARGAGQPLLFVDSSSTEPEMPPYVKVSVSALLNSTDYADMKASMHRFGGYLLSVKGASHMDFTDQPLVSPLRQLSHRGSVSAEELQGILRTYVIAFFDKTLRGEDPQILHTRTGPYAEASLETWAPAQPESTTQVHAEGR
jgi:hypothetical protein